MADKYVAYVGTYTHEHSRGIYVYDVDPKEGLLTEKEVVEIHNPSNLTVAHNGKFLYSIADEGIAAFKIKEDGTLEKINQSWLGGMRGCHVCMDSKDRYVFVAGYHDGRVTMMSVNADGSIGEVSDGVFHQGVGKSIAEKRLDPHVTSVELTPDEKFLCAVDNGLHQIKVYEVDYTLGKLKLVDIVRVPLDTYPKKIRFSNDGKNAYVITEGSNEIYAFSYQVNEKGMPQFEQIQTLEYVNTKHNQIAEGANLKFADNDKYLFASVDGLNAIIMFTRDQNTGLLTYLDLTYISGDYPKNFALLPGDKFYACLNHESNTIRTFRIDYKEGHCLQKNKPIKIEKPNCIYIHKLV